MASEPAQRLAGSKLRPNGASAKYPYYFSLAKSFDKSTAQIKNLGREEEAIAKQIQEDEEEAKAMCRRTE